MIEHGRAELVEAAVGELHLRLDADGRGHVPTAETLGQVPQQRALADARLPQEDDDLALTGKRIRQEPVEGLTFGSTSQEPHRPPPWPRTRLRTRILYVTRVSNLLPRPTRRTSGQTSE